MISTWWVGQTMTQTLGWHNEQWQAGTRAQSTRQLGISKQAEEKSDGSRWNQERGGWGKSIIVAPAGISRKQHTMERYWAKADLVTDLAPRPVRIIFLLRSVYGVLPTTANLKRWKLTEDSACPLCEKISTLNHIIMLSCNIALPKEDTDDVTTEYSGN